MNVPYHARPVGEPEDAQAKLLALYLARDYAQAHGRPVAPDDLLVRRYLRATSDDPRGYTHDLLLVLVPRQSSGDVRDLILSYARGDLDFQVLDGS